MNIFKSSLLILLTVVGTFAADSAIGFGKDTTGGKGGKEYHVKTFKELKNALDPAITGPRIVYIESSINGFEDEKDGHILTAKEVCPEYDFDKYVACFTADGKAWTNTTECNEIEKYRMKGFNTQKDITFVLIPSDTTIIGSGLDAKLEEVSLQVMKVNNVIIKNLYIQAPTDMFPAWDPEDSGGNWNSEYDGIVVNGSTNVWIDNCYLTDGDKTDDTYPVIFGKHIEAHDGLLDVVNGSDFVTISNNRFEDHEKSLLIGNNDKKVDIDTGHLRVTFYNNVFINCGQRLPRVRFGKVHIFNNYYYADFVNKHNIKPSYFIGLGKECNILSEYNSFNVLKNGVYNSKYIVAKSFKGNVFHDNGSELNGVAEDIDALTKKEIATLNTITFEPSEFYEYTINKDFNYINDLINHIPSFIVDESGEVKEPFIVPKPKEDTKTTKTKKPKTTEAPKPEPTETQKQDDIPKPEPTETQKQDDTPKPEPTETQKQDDTPKPEPTKTQKQDDTPKPEPTKTQKQDDTPKPQPTETQKPEDVPKPQPTETPKPNESISKDEQTADSGTSGANSIIKLTKENLIIISMTIFALINLI